MHIHCTFFTFESLPDQPPEQAATVVTEGRAHVVVNFEAVRHVDVETFLLKHCVSAVGCSTSTPPDDFINTFLMNSSVALPTFVSLFVQSPDEVFADRTKRGLSKEGSDKFMIFDVVDFCLLDSSSPVDSYCSLFFPH